MLISTVYSDTFRHSRYVTYRVKDAIADYWNEKEGKRPNVRLTDPDLNLNIHIAQETVTVSLDSSGESLHKRGYRVRNTEAPLAGPGLGGGVAGTDQLGETHEKTPPHRIYRPLCRGGRGVRLRRGLTKA